MAKKRKYDFNMGHLLTLYNTDLDKGREYLYDNMSVFSDVRGTELLYNNAKDIYHDTFVVIDDMIQKSIEKGYDERQIYQYIKKRVWGELHNRKIKYSKITGDYCEIDEDEAFDKDPLGTMNDGVLIDMMRDKISQIEEPYQTILLLTHFVTPKKSLKQIGALIGSVESKVQFDYNKGIEILKEIVKNENLY